MTIATTTNRVDCPGNGSATAFSFAPVVIFDASNLQVTIRDSAGVETALLQGGGSVNYSVSVAKYPGTGSVVYPASGGTPLPTGSTLVIKRIVPLLQKVSLVNQGAYFPSIQEGEFDYLTAIDQQQQEQINRTVQVAATDPAIPILLPTSAVRAGKFLGFDGVGAPVAAIPAGVGVPISTVMVPVVASASLASALMALSTPTPGAPFGVPAFEVHAAINQNAIIGSVDNNSGPATVSFPCGITGYGKVSAGATGNTVYGVFGRGDLYDKGVALNEFDSFNFSGHAATTATPPDLTIGTNGYYPIAALVAAYGTSSSAIGLMVAYGEQPFETGIYMHANAYNTTGLFIDAQNGGSNAVLALIRGSGVKPMLTLQAMNGAGAAPANAMFEIQDALGNVPMHINQSGDVINAGFNLTAAGMLTFLNAGISTSATGGAASALPAAPFKYVTVTVNGTVGKIPFYNT